MHEALASTVHPTHCQKNYLLNTMSFRGKKDRYQSVFQANPYWVGWQALHVASHLNGQLGLSWLELALETGWSRILTDLQKVRAAEADGKHFFRFSLCNKCFSTVAEGILTATDRMVPNLESLSLPLSKIGA